MRIIVTGASGYIGGHLAIALKRAGHTVFSTYLRSDIPEEVVKASEQAFQVDLSDFPSVGMLVEKARPDAVVHCAALSRIADCDANPDLASTSNEIATGNLVSVLGQLSYVNGPPKLLYTSTDLVFDGQTAPDGGWAEEEIPNPVTIYAKTKLGGEQSVREYPGPWHILRTCLVYGKPIGTQKKFFDSMVESLRAGTPLKLFTDEYRTPIAIDDIADAVFALLKLPNQTDAQSEFSVVNLAGSERLSRFEFGGQLCSALGAAAELLVASKLADGPPGMHRSSDVSLNAVRLTKLLGRCPRNVREGLQLVLST